MAKFEEDLAELERVVERLEQGELPLDESVGLFERGVHLSRACKSALGSAESRIQVLSDTEGGGPGRVEELAKADVEDEGEEYGGVEDDDDEE